MVLDRASVKASAKKLNDLVEDIAIEVEDIIKASGLEGVGAHGIKSELFVAISSQLAERLQTPSVEKKVKGIIDVNSNGVLIRDDIGIRLLPLQVFLTSEQKKKIAKDPKCERAELAQLRKKLEAKVVHV
ncbi:MAG: hypothetical protein MN733_39135 [Nitrososphaera sp.]|nr:hypothetical protein [Nitrososphaera sp.]